MERVAWRMRNAARWMHRNAWVFGEILVFLAMVAVFGFAFCIVKA